MPTPWSQPVRLTTLLERRGVVTGGGGGTGGTGKIFVATKKGIGVLVYLENG